MIRMHSIPAMPPFLVCPASILEYIRIVTSSTFNKKLEIFESILESTRKKWRLRRHFCSLRLPIETYIGIRMASELLQDVLRGQEKFQMTNFTMKYPFKSDPGLHGPHGDGDGPRAPPRCQGGLEKISND